MFPIDMFPIDPKLALDKKKTKSYKNRFMGCGLSKTKVLGKNFSEIFLMYY